MNYDDWRTDNGRDTWGGRDTRESSCIKCGVLMDVAFDYIGQPWCDRCVARDKRMAEKFTDKRRSA